MKKPLMSRLVIGCAAAVVAVGCSGSAFGETLPNWTVTWTNDAHTAGVAANDQNALVLRIYRRTADYGGFGLGIGCASGNSTGQGVASAGDPEVAAYLDMRGPVTGLDYKANPATNAVWKFSYLHSNCFRPNDGVKLASGLATPTPAQWISGLRTPGTLAADGWNGPFHIDTSPNPNRTKELIVDEPFFTGNIGGWGLNSMSGLTNLVFNVPKATKMTDPVSHATLNWKTDIGKFWDLSSVKYVGGTSATDSPGNGPFAGGISGMTGVLRLPSLCFIAASPTTSGAAFRACNISEALLGANGNLTYLAPHSFLNCNSLTNVYLGTVPGTTLTIRTNAFVCSSLKRVTFNGDMPKFTDGYAATAPCFGTTNTAEGTITFYVRNRSSWADVLAEAEKNGGFVAAETLHTAKRQKVIGYSHVTVELQDPRFAEKYHESVKLTPAADCQRIGDNDYIGALTIEATCSEPDDAATDPRRSRFLRWDGVPVALERQNPLTYVPTKDAEIKAVFAHDWIMTDDAEPNRTMTNGIWRVCCYKRTPETDHYLGIGKSMTWTGKGAAWPTNAADRIGGGDLNLNGDVWEKLADGTWQKWTTVSCCAMAAWSTNVTKWVGVNPTIIKQNGEYDKLPTRLTYPETLLFYPGELANYDSWDNDAVPWPLTEVIAILPKAEGTTITAFTVGGCRLVSRLVIRAPKVTGLGSGNTIYGLSWSNSTFTKTDFDEWDLSGVTQVNDNAFRCGVDMKATGTLNLPNVQTVGTNAFMSLNAMTGLMLGTNKLCLAKIDDIACTGLKALTSLTIGSKNLQLGSKLGASSVFNLPKLTTLRFLGRALPTATIDAMLSGVAESSAEKQVTLYASPNLGWLNLSTTMTDEEKTVAPEGAFGVYRNGLRKAWFVPEPSPFDPRGGYLLLK